EPKSPLLGFFTPYKLSLIKPIDIFSTLIRRYDPVKSLELASYMRDPWLIPLYGGEDTVSFIYKDSCKYWQIVKALIGEVFAEEERTLTKTYEAILSLLGSRVWRVKDITGILYAKRVIREPSSSHVSGFIKNLMEMDLVESIKLFKTRRKYYRLKSPIMETFYYLENKFDVSEREVSLDEVRLVLEKIIRLEVEDFIAEFFAHYYNGRREYSLDPEIDFIITLRKRILAIGEVKWGKYTRQDLKKFYKKVETLPGVKIFITKEKDQSYYRDIRIYDARDLANMTFKHD
ncbi:MAG: ATP-binding protein, partial [Thermoprotei archaeon]